VCSSPSVIIYITSLPCLTATWAARTLLAMGALVHAMNDDIQQVMGRTNTSNSARLPEEALQSKMGTSLHKLLFSLFALSAISAGCLFPTNSGFFFVRARESCAGLTDLFVESADSDLVFSSDDATGASHSCQAHDGSASETSSHLLFRDSAGLFHLCAGSTDPSLTSVSAGASNASRPVQALSGFCSRTSFHLPVGLCFEGLHCADLTDSSLACLTAGVFGAQTRALQGDGGFSPMTPFCSPAKLVSEGVLRAALPGHQQHSTHMALLSHWYFSSPSSAAPSCAFLAFDVGSGHLKPELAPWLTPDPHPLGILYCSRLRGSGDWEAWRFFPYGSC
jgi:hypothetical protein